MEKLVKIKWRKTDIKKLSNYVRKFNTAVTKFEKAHPEFEESQIIPERLKMDEVKSQIKTRKDYNDIIKRIDRFFKKGARDITDIAGVKVTKWMKRELQYANQREVNRQKKKAERLKLTKDQMKRENIKTSTFEQRAERLRKEFEKNKDFDYFNSQWQNLVYKTLRETRSSKEREDSIRFYNQYKSMLYNNLSPEDADKVLEVIKRKKLWGSDLYHAIELDDTLSPDFIYGPQESFEKGDYIIEVLEEIFPDDS